jgi:hypothetical protein
VLQSFETIITIITRTDYVVGESCGVSRIEVVVFNSQASFQVLLVVGDLSEFCDV